MIEGEHIPRLRRATQMLVAAQVDIDTFLLVDDTPNVSMKRQVAVLQEKIDGIVEQLEAIATSEAARPSYVQPE